MSKVVEWDYFHAACGAGGIVVTFEDGERRAFVAFGECSDSCICNDCIMCRVDAVELVAGLAVAETRLGVLLSR